MITPSKSNRRTSFGGVALLCLVLMLIQTPRMVLEWVDVCDVGNQLAKQQSLFVFHEIRGAVGMTILSDYIGGAWLSLCPSAGILWMRFGGVVLTTLSAGFSFLILSKSFGPKKAGFAVVVAAALISTIAPYGLLVHYYTVPVLFLSFSLWALSITLEIPGVRPLSQAHGWVWVGIGAGGAVFARLPLIVLLIIACCGFVVEFLRADRSIRAGRLLSFLAFSGGVLLVTFVIFSALATQDLLGDYFRSIMFCFSPDACNDLYEYSLRSLLPMYFVRGLKAVSIAICLMIGFWTLRYRFPNKAASFGYIWASVLACIGFFLGTGGPAQAIQRFREVLVGFIIIQCVRHSCLEWRKGPAFTLIFGSSGLMVLAMALGSTLGLQPAVWGMFFALPATFLVLDQTIGYGTVEHQGYQDRGMVGPAVASLAVIALFCPILSSSLTWRGGTRFSEGADYLTYSIPPLKGSRGDSKTVRSVEGLYQYLHEAVSKGDRAVFYNGVGILYWATQTRCALISPVLYHSRPNVLECQLERLKDSGNLPRVVVIATRTESANVPIELLGEYAMIKRCFSMTFGYRIGYTNSVFEVLQAP